MIGKIKNKIEFLYRIYNLNRACRKFCRGHQVQLYNWSRPFSQDLWLIDFIEKRGLRHGNDRLKIALYSVFGPHWMTRFDNADARIFVERENLHKPHFEGFLHRYLEDEGFSLSLGFDDINHPQYMRFPFWLMWTVFPPTVTYKDIQDFAKRLNNVKKDPKILDFCAYVCSHDDLNRKRIYEEFNSIAPLSCPGRLFHNDDRLRRDFGDDKIAYLRNFKFNLTPENTNCKGYVTEKLFEAISAETVPIYHGSDNNPEPDIINKNAVIFIELGKDNKASIDFVRELHHNDKLYVEFSSQPRLVPHAEDCIWNYYEELERRLRGIIKNL